MSDNTEHSFPVRRSDAERLAYIDGWVAGATCAQLSTPEFVQVQLDTWTAEASELRRKIYGS